MPTNQLTFLRIRSTSDAVHYLQVGQIARIDTTLNEAYIYLINTPDPIPVDLNSLSTLQQILSRDGAIKIINCEAGPLEKLAASEARQSTESLLAQNTAAFEQVRQFLSLRSGPIS